MGQLLLMSAGSQSLASNPRLAVESFDDDLALVARGMGKSLIKYPLTLGNPRIAAPIGSRCKNLAPVAPRMTDPRCDHQAHGRNP